MLRLLFFAFVLFLGVTVQVFAGEDVVVNFADPVFARLDATERALLSEYAKIYPKIKHFYGNIRMDADVTESDQQTLAEEGMIDGLKSLRLSLQLAGLDENEVENQVEQWREQWMEGVRQVGKHRQHELYYRRLDGHIRVGTKVYSSIVSSVARTEQPHRVPQRDSVQEVRIALLTPTTNYQLSKNDPSKPHFSLNVRRNANHPNALNDIVIPMVYFDTAPFFSNHTPLENIVFQPPSSIKGMPFIVEYVRERENNGKRVVEIRYTRTDLTDSFREIKLDREFWVVKESYTRTGVMLSAGNREIRCYSELCTYGDVVDGIPLLKTYQRSEGIYDPETQAETISRRMMCEVTRLVPGPPDLSEFDVAQFLPPGAKVGENITPAILSPARIAAIVIGVIIILGIYLKIRDARKG